MLTLDGVVDQPLKVTEPITVRGTVRAPVEVLGGGELLLDGTATADLTVRRGGSAEINGTVYGIVTNEGGRLLVRGVVYGRVIPNEGDTEIAPGAIVTNDPLYPKSTATFTRVA